MIVGGFSALITAVKAWNNEEKRLFVNNFIFEQSKQYTDFKGLQKTVIQMMISEPFIGLLNRMVLDYMPRVMM